MARAASAGCSISGPTRPSSPQPGPVDLGPVIADQVTGWLQHANVVVKPVLDLAAVAGEALALMGGGRIDVKPLITDTFGFADSVKAFDFACRMPPTSVKAQIVVEG